MLLLVIGRGSRRGLVARNRVLRWMERDNDGEKKSVLRGDDRARLLRSAIDA